jgi:hypothetical protein
MEIKLDSILDLDAWELSHSAFEGGPTAARDTWKASLDAAEDTQLLDTEEKLQAMRAFAVSSGGWTRGEIANWDSLSLNALFLQWVAGDCRQLGADSLAEIDWEEARELQENGIAPLTLFKGDNGSVYFYLGN